MVAVNKDNKAEEALDSSLPSISACIAKSKNRHSLTCTKVKLSLAFNLKCHKCLS